MILQDRASLAAARGAIDLDQVTVRTARLKHRNLLPLALKYALWATRVGGRIVVEDDGGKDAAPPAYSVSFNLVRQWVFKFIGAECALVEMAPGRLVLERTAPVLAPGWSAGVVFSGNDGEVPTLLACLAGLARQPELDAAAGGEIWVCGPERDRSFLQPFPQVRYLPFETPPGPRFLIGQKKNALMAAMRGPRLAVLHARVVLDAGALAAVPREFDISGPATRVLTRHGGERPYLSLIQTDAVWPGVAAARTTIGLRDLAQPDPLALIERGGVFVDGGAFFVTRPVFDACPLHPQIAWEEGEDVEWCGRAFAQGFLVDLAPGSGAVSQSNKLGDWSRLGGLERIARRASTEAKAMRAGVRDRLARLGKRR
jgi:hypothetical protein